MTVSRTMMAVAVAVVCVAATAHSAFIRPGKTTEEPSLTTISQECWPYCPNNHTYLANPRNCSTYYACTNNLDGILQACPTGLVFVPSEQECDWPAVYECKDDPDAPCATHPPTQPTTVAAETTADPDNSGGRTLFPPRLGLSSDADSAEQDDEVDVSSGEAAGGLPVCPDPVCPEQYGLMGNPGDCSSFYSCNNYMPILMRCPDGLEFKPKKAKCVWPKNSKCTETCVLP